MNRRVFLRAGLLAGAAAAVALGPAPALAQAAPVIVEIVNGIARIPASVAASMSPWQANLANRSVQRVLQVSAQQGLSRSAANALLTQSVRPVLAARGAGGLVRGLAMAGLLIGLTWALQDAAVNLSGSDVVATRSVNTSSMMSYPYESTITNVGTGVYRNQATNPTALVAYQRTTIQGWSGGTVPAPSGWSWVYQRNVSGGVEVWFSKTLASGVTSATFPPIPLERAGDAASAAQVVQESSLVALEPHLAKAALLDATALPFGQSRPYPVPSSASEPLPYPWPSAAVSGGTWTAPTWGDITSPVTAPSASIDPATVPWQFPDVVEFPNGNPTPTPSPTPTTSEPPYAAGDPVEPDGVGDLPGFNAFVDPFRHLFNPFRDVFAGSDAACPPFNLPAIAFPPYGSIAGQTITYHCELFEPFRSVIVAASTAAGGWAAVSHIMDA